MLAAASLAALVALVAVTVVGARSAPDGSAPCGAGFTRQGTRCCPGRSTSPAPGRCAHPRGAACPAPLVATPRGCDAAERDVVEIPAATVTVGPADWEAEGRVRARAARVEAFAIDRLEVTVGRACALDVFAGSPACDAAHLEGDAARAVSGVSLHEARVFCASKGGRLPTEDEWLAAAGGERPRRYPWGDTGAVCRRAAWGLASGPCGDGAIGPDTVGAHPEGATPLGVHDLAGNVAEWVEAPCPEPALGCPRIVRGGSWSARLATELRTWLGREVADAGGDVAGDPTIGFRCAYDLTPKR